MGFTETISSQTVTTRKKHQCFSCLRIFEPGTRMNHWVGNVEGDFNSNYSCMTCVEIMNMRQDPDEDYFPEGYVREGLKDGETPEQLLERLKCGEEKI